MRIRKDRPTISEDTQFIAKASEALAHPARVEIFKYILDQNRERHNVCTKELVEVFGYSQSTISQHMQKLVASGLVEGKKENAFNYYFVSLGNTAKYLNEIKAIFSRK